MQEVILDTDILSEILKGIDPEVSKYQEAYQGTYQRLNITSPSVMEVLTGYRKRGAMAQLQRAAKLFAENIEIVPESSDYRLAAEINGDLLRTGKIVGMVDPLICACAIRRGYGVATGNTDHFEFVRGLGYAFHLENWRKL